jgi:hypothetical protein
MKTVHAKGGKLRIPLDSFGSDFERIGFTDRTGNKPTCRFLAEFMGRVDLLPSSLSHHGKAVRKGEGLSLIVSDGEQRYFNPLPDVFQFDLHRVSFRREGFNSAVTQSKMRKMRPK